MGVAECPNDSMASDTAEPKQRSSSTFSLTQELTPKANAYEEGAPVTGKRTGGRPPISRDYKQLGGKINFARIPPSCSSRRP